jgi:hypothetical protein
VHVYTPIVNKSQCALKRDDENLTASVADGFKGFRTEVRAAKI